MSSGYSYVYFQKKQELDFGRVEGDLAISTFLGNRSGKLLCLRVPPWNVLVTSPSSFFFVWKIFLESIFFQHSLSPASIKPLSRIPPRMLSELNFQLRCHISHLPLVNFSQQSKTKLRGTFCQWNLLLSMPPCTGQEEKWKTELCHYIRKIVIVTNKNKSTVLLSVG